MFRFYFGFLPAIFCSGTIVSANTLNNPSNANMNDYRVVPLFNENDVIRGASYSDLQTAGLSSDHLQTYPDGVEFYWEISTIIKISVE